MALTSISPAMQQRLAVAVPIVALGISLFVVYPAWGRYQDLQVEAGKLEKELATLKENPVEPPGPVLPADKRSDEESAGFLRLTQDLANASGCRLMGMNSAPTESKADQLARPIRTAVELEAPYPRIRGFLFQVANADRVLSVTDVRISSPGSTSSQPFGNTGLLKADIGIERYVTTATDTNN
jgi:hypothetical protein